MTLSTSRLFSAYAGMTSTLKKWSRATQIEQNSFRNPSHAQFPTPALKFTKMCPLKGGGDAKKVRAPAVSSTGRIRSKQDQRRGDRGGIQPKQEQL
jgi:hypothetical protein